jgi:uncharacterized lipoprotein YajG
MSIKNDVGGKVKKTFERYIFVMTIFTLLAGCATEPKYSPMPMPMRTAVAMPATVSPQPVYKQSPTNSAYTKYNPKTGKVFPANYDFDPDSGEALKSIQ